MYRDSAGTAAGKAGKGGAKHVRTGPDLRDLDREIAQVRRDKDAAIDAQDFENAAVLRDRERQLLSDQAAREQEWATFRP
jgi:protein-arginine kinase activator protein McsA